MRGIAVALGAVLLPALCLSQGKPITLEFRSLLRPSDRGLAPTKALLDANGKRVRMKGFMPLMETPPIGGFWLSPTPVFQDESGAGTGDLPPNSVFVMVRGAGQRPVKYLAGLLSVSGKLKLNPSSPRIVITLDSSKDIVAKTKPLRTS